MRSPTPITLELAQTCASRASVVLSVKSVCFVATIYVLTMSASDRQLDFLVRLPDPITAHYYQSPIKAQTWPVLVLLY
jgi:hypothetical protein